MREYREEEGLGCWGCLAEKAEVTEDIIRRMLDKGRIPYSVWIKVGRALGMDPLERETK